MTLLTAEKVIGIVGADRLDDHQVSQILNLSATEEELIEAYERCVRGNAVGTETRHAPGAQVLRLVEILSSDESQWDDD